MLLTPRRDVGLGTALAYLVCNSHRLSQFLSSFVCLRRCVEVRALYVGTSHGTCRRLGPAFVFEDALRGVRTRREVAMCPHLAREGIVVLSPEEIVIAEEGEYG